MIVVTMANDSNEVWRCNTAGTIANGGSVYVAIMQKSNKTDNQKQLVLYYTSFNST